MTMTLADTSRIDDGGVSPRADRPKRRSFTAEYTSQVLAEYDAADHGERGAIQRREGLHSSHITEWRKAAQAGASTALGPKTRDRRDREIEQLRVRAEKAEAELVKTRARAHRSHRGGDQPGRRGTRRADVGEEGV